MTFLEQYQQDALRTEAPLPEAMLRLSKVPLCRLNHAVLGLISDLHELRNATDGTNAKEETSDLFWFLNLGMSALRKPVVVPGVFEGKALDARAVNAPAEHLKMLSPSYKRDTLKLVGTPEGAVDFMFDETCQLADAVKAAIHYGKALFDPPEESINSLGKQSFEWTVEYRLKNITAALSYYCLTHLRVAPHTTMEANIAKLRARFPDAYSQDRALVRDKDAERNAIDGSGIDRFPKAGAMASGVAAALQARQAHTQGALLGAQRQDT